jgi:hypothetical protein
MFRLVVLQDMSTVTQDEIRLVVEVDTFGRDEIYGQVTRFVLLDCKDTSSQLGLGTQYPSTLWMVRSALGEPFANGCTARLDVHAMHITPDGAIESLA